MNRLRSVELYRDDQRRLVAIEAMTFSPYYFDHGGQLFGSIVPLVIVVCRPNGKEVMTMTQDKDGLAKLKQQHPELDAMIAGMSYRVS